MNRIAMSISDEAVVCTAQIEMLNELLKSDLTGFHCCLWGTIIGVINSSIATLMVTVIDDENF